MPIRLLPLRARSLGIFAPLLLALPCPSQAQPAFETTSGPARARDLANAILHWVVDFQEGRLHPQGRVSISHDSPLLYIKLGVRGAALGGPNQKAASNFAVLQQLVTGAEKNPSAEVAIALLALSSVGLAKDMFNHRLLPLRDLGHFAVLRMEAATVWHCLYDIAMQEPRLNKEGEEVPADLPLEPDGDRPLLALEDQAIWRISAVRLLGMKGRGVFRSSIEKILTHRDGRVRLAAAEALGHLHHPKSLPTITRVLSGERHPMVVVALVQAVQRILNKHAHTVETERSGLAIRTALSRLGQVDWRSDMAIVQLIHNHPIKAAVPVLIALMRYSRGDSDPILKIINGKASRFLGMEAHRALRKITGAIVPDDPDKWQAFWEAEQDKLVVRRTVKLDKSRTVSTMRSGGSFYGIPVLGSEVVFVLDTSGSMKERVTAKSRGPITGPKRGTTMYGTRLSIARRQTLKAVQGMPKNARFSIVTFNSDVRAWNRKPVKMDRRARSTAARILGRLKPKGGTNVFEALVHVLEARSVGYGDRATKEVDEVFILSDGQPSSGELTNPEEILQVVREVNRLRKVRINTVFAGSGAGADFMRKLAEENGGVFVQQ